MAGRNWQSPNAVQLVHPGVDAGCCGVHVVKRELNYALIEKRYQERIIPLLFKKCNYRRLSWTLPQFQWIDFTKDYRHACEQLLRVWKKRLKDSVRRKRNFCGSYLWIGQALNRVYPSIPGSQA